MSRRPEFFSSRLGLILTALGMAVGTGNIWRFPRILAQNGGGALIITWLVFLFAWSIPLLVMEFGLGRGSRRGFASGRPPTSPGAAGAGWEVSWPSAPRPSSSITRWWRAGA